LVKMQPIAVERKIIIAHKLSVLGFTNQPFFSKFHLKVEF